MILIASEDDVEMDGNWVGGELMLSGVSRALVHDGARYEVIPLSRTRDENRQKMHRFSTNFIDGTSFDDILSEPLQENFHHFFSPFHLHF